MKTRWLLALLLFASASSAFAQTAGVLDSILSQSASLTNTWIDRAIDLAKKIFGAIVVIEFVWFAMQTVLKKSEIGELVGSLAFKIVAIGFFYTLIHYSPTWIPAIQQSFLQAGANISGLSLDTFTPSRIIDYGVQAAGKMLGDFNNIANDEIAKANFFDKIGVVGKNLLAAIIMAISALLVIIAFAIIAIQFLVTMLESYLVIGAGAVMLGFSGSRWTMNFAEKYLGYAVSVGAKLITVTVLVGFGQSFADGIIQHWDSIRAGTGAAAPKFSDYMSIAGGALVFSAMSYMLPGLAGSMLNGVASMSLSNTAGAASSATVPAVTNAARAGGLVAAGGASLLARAATMAAPAGAIAGVSRPTGGGGGSGDGGGGALGGLVRSAFVGASSASAANGAASGPGSATKAASRSEKNAHSANATGADTPVSAPASAGTPAGADGKPLSGSGATNTGSDENNPGGPVTAAARGTANTLRGSGDNTGTGFENPRAPEPPRPDFRATAQPPRDASWRDYRDEERERERERRARASAGKFSRMLLKAADKSQDSADAMSAFARRNRRPLQSDGHVGAAPGIRMRIDD